MSRVLPAACAGVICFALVGCGGVFLGLDAFGGATGNLSLTSADLDSDASISDTFDAVYAVTDEDTMQVVLVAGPIENPTQAVHIQMYWRPKAGKTPFDPSATNAVVRYVVFDGEQVGVYGGGGMLRLHDRPGEPTFTGSLLNATVRLLDASESYASEPIGGNALAEGRFTATLDEQRTQELVRQLSGLVERKLGYPRFVISQDTQ